jgi:opacity protein-like surface antigen
MLFEEIAMKSVAPRAAAAAAFLCLAVLAGPPVALAQWKAEHRPWEFSFFGGGSFIGDGQYPTDVVGSAQTTSRTVGLRYGGGYLMGASVTENRFPHLGATFEYTFANQPLEFTNLVDQPPTVGVGHSVHRFAYELVYYPLDSLARLRPYIFAGPGLTLFQVGENSILTGTSATRRLSDPWKFSVTWGGGVKYLIVDHWAASVQFSDAVTGVPGYGLPPTSSVTGTTVVPGFRPDGFLNQKMITMGIIYQWNTR